MGKQRTRADDQEATAPVTQTYVALRRIGGDGELWLPGSLIELTEEKARILIERGAVTPHVGTIPPAPTPPVIVVHEPAPVEGAGGIGEGGG